MAGSSKKSQRSREVKGHPKGSAETAEIALYVRPYTHGGTALAWPVKVTVPKDGKVSDLRTAFEQQDMIGPPQPPSRPRSRNAGPRPGSRCANTASRCATPMEGDIEAPKPGRFRGMPLVWQGQKLDEELELKFINGLKSYSTFTFERPESPPISRAASPVRQSSKLEMPDLVEDDEIETLEKLQGSLDEKLESITARIEARNEQLKQEEQAAKERALKVQQIQNVLDQVGGMLDGACATFGSFDLISSNSSDGVDLELDGQLDGLRTQLAHIQHVCGRLRGEIDLKSREPDLLPTSPAAGSAAAAAKEISASKLVEEKARSSIVAGVMNGILADEAPEIPLGRPPSDVEERARNSILMGAMDSSLLDPPGIPGVEKTPEKVEMQQPVDNAAKSANQGEKSAAIHAKAKRSLVTGLRDGSLNKIVDEMEAKAEGGTTDAEATPAQPMDQTSVEKMPEKEELTNDAAESDMLAIHAKARSSLISGLRDGTLNKIVDDMETKAEQSTKDHEGTSVQPTDHAGVEKISKEEETQQPTKNATESAKSEKSKSINAKARGSLISGLRDGSLNKIVDGMEAKEEVGITDAEATPAQPRDQAVVETMPVEEELREPTDNATQPEKSTAIHAKAMSSLISGLRDGSLNKIVDEMEAKAEVGTDAEATHSHLADQEKAELLNEARKVAVMYCKELYQRAIARCQENKVDASTQPDKENANQKSPIDEINKKARGSLLAGYRDGTLDRILNDMEAKEQSDAVDAQKAPAEDNDEAIVKRGGGTDNDGAHGKKPEKKRVGGSLLGSLEDGSFVDAMEAGDQAKQTSPGQAMRHCLSNSLVDGSLVEAVSRTAEVADWQHKALSLFFMGLEDGRLAAALEQMQTQRGGKVDDAGKPEMPAKKDAAETNMSNQDIVGLDAAAEKDAEAKAR